MFQSSDSRGAQSARLSEPWVRCYMDFKYRERRRKKKSKLWYKAERKKKFWSKCLSTRHHQRVLDFFKNRFTLLFTCVGIKNLSYHIISCLITVIYTFSCMVCASCAF